MMSCLKLLPKITDNRPKVKCEATFNHVVFKVVTIVTIQGNFKIL